MTIERRGAGPHGLNAVYRIVWSNPPTIDDFRPNIEMSIEARDIGPDAARLHTGISVYRTWAQARRTARKRPPWLGRGYIAEILIPIGAAARVERTMKSAGHYTLWDDAGRVVEGVSRVEPVGVMQAKDHGL